MPVLQLSKITFRAFIDGRPGVYLLTPAAKTTTAGAINLTGIKFRAKLPNDIPNDV